MSLYFAILMVLEHCIAALQDGFTDIKILSDSQTAVGILNLNWKSSNYIDTITDIKEPICGFGISKWQAFPSIGIGS
jgi:ribonuclease HI